MKGAPPRPRPTLVLASTSSYRAQLLAQLGLAFEQDDPGLDEQPWKERGLGARELVVELARAKAEAVAERHPGALILGADQVVWLDGEILGKPGGPDGAVDQLLRLQGRTHELVTGLALLDARSGVCRTEVQVHRVTLRPLGRAAIEHYVAADRPEHCAGSYKVESLGIALFDRLDGSDYTGIIGLPLTVVTRLLVQAGVDPLEPPDPAVRAG